VDKRCLNDEILREKPALALALAMHPALVSHMIEAHKLTDSERQLVLILSSIVVLDLAI
jgi:hypothetical protein